MRSLILGLTLSLIAAGAVAQDKPPADPVLGERLVDGVATKATLWLKNDRGAVVAFDRATGARTVVATDGVFGLVRVGGVTAALKKVDGEPGQLAVLDLNTGKLLTPPVQGPVAVLARAGEDWVVLGKDAVLRSNGGPWRRQPYQPFARPRFGVIVMAAVADGSVYTGYNMGEWGGGLWRLAPGSDRFVEINGGKGCEDELSSVCNPVTGLIRDPARPDCVLAAVGLSHMFSHRGRIMRVCGETAQQVFRKPVEPSGDANEIVMTGNSWPLFGLIASPGGWTAVTRGRLVVSKNGQADVIPAPELKPWAGLMLAETDGVILVPTDVNWGMSVSGYTPLLIPVTE